MLEEEYLHLFQSSVNSKEYWREDVRLNDRIESCAKFYEETFRKSHTDLTGLPTALAVNGVMAKTTPYKNGILSINSLDKIGVAGLILSGLNEEDESSCCIQFMKKFNKKPEFHWKLPIPPLEITSRPLLYLVYFRISENKVGEFEWQQLVREVLTIACGISVSYLRNWDYSISK